MIVYRLDLFFITVPTLHWISNGLFSFFAAGAEVLDKWQQKADICIGVIVSLSGISNVWNMLHKLATSFQWVKVSSTSKCYDPSEVRYA